MRRLIPILLCAASVLAAQQVTITMLATTDLHGNLFPVDYVTGQPVARGLAKIATLIRQARAVIVTGFVPVAWISTLVQLPATTGAARSCLTMVVAAVPINLVIATAPTVPVVLRRTAYAEAAVSRNRSSW